MKGAILSGLIALAPVCVAAATTGEEDSMVINRINASDFEVVETRSMGAADFWCGAATFVERRSGLSNLTEIYLKRSRGPSVITPGRNAVVFSTSPAGLPRPESRLSLSVDRPGDMIKSVQARRYCRDAFTRSTK
jgi:hypothetical protein